MRAVRQKVVAGHLAYLGLGSLIGWLYSEPLIGLLFAALSALVWHLRQLLRFESALQSKHFGSLKYGDGIWSQLYSRFIYQRGRNKYYRKQYRQLLKEVRKSTNAMPDGGIILNSNFEIVLCNQAAASLAGFRQREDRGQRVDNILRNPAFAEYIRLGDQSAGLEIPSPVRTGGWLLCRMVPYGVDEQLLLLQDITERRRLAAMRRDFVANASHELRSPLTVITGYLDVISSDPDVPAEWQKPLQQMQGQAIRMNKIVGELLELSRLESSGSAGSDEIVDVCSLLSTARIDYANQEGIAEIRLNCTSRVQLHGSSTEIASLIINLLSNAVRHTPPDGTITLSWATSADGAVLEVADNGSGIAAEHLPRLTERFFRVDSGRSRDDGGVGLGLAIVKHILERHQAELRIDSVPGDGSHFECRFPASRLAAAEPVAIASQS